MALTMTEEQEREIRKALTFAHRGDWAESAAEALLGELDATRAELARLRAEMPSEGSARRWNGCGRCGPHVGRPLIVC